MSERSGKYIVEGQENVIPFPKRQLMIDGGPPAPYGPKKKPIVIPFQRPNINNTD